MSAENGTIMKYKIICFLVLLSSLVGCASATLTSPFTAAKPEKNKAIIYLYRLETQIHSANPDIPVFTINGQKIGPLNIGGYYAIQADEGPVEITYQESGFLGLGYLFTNKKLKTVAKSGHVYFIKYEVGMMSYYFDFVPSAAGLRDIETTRLLVP